MISLGLTVANQRALISLLKNHHSINIKVQVLLLDHTYVGDVSRRLVDGQVDIDMEAEVTRSLKMTILDPNHAIHLDSNSPSDGAMFVDRMIRVIYNVTSPDGSKSFDIPIFCGPITKLDRTGVYLAVEAQGKESMVIPTAWNAKTYKRGMRKTSVIFSLLYDRGERKLSIPTISTTIPRDVAVGYDTSPWTLAKQLALSLGYYLFYDGRGQAVMRKRSPNPVVTFTEYALRSTPQIGYTTEKMINAVQVISSPPEGSKGPTIRRVAIAPITHPFSPARLSRAGVPGYYPLIIRDNEIKTIAEADRRAGVELYDGLISSVSVAFDCLPHPMVEGGDICYLMTDEYTVIFNMMKMSIPLSAKGVSTVGYNRRVTPNLNAIRVRKR